VRIGRCSASLGDLLKLIWFIVIGLFRSRTSLEAEILALRHQLNVLRRKVGRRSLLAFFQFPFPGRGDWFGAARKLEQAVSLPVSPQIDEGGVPNGLAAVDGLIVVPFLQGLTAYVRGQIVQLALDEPACTSSFSRLARRSLALRPAHSRCHLFVTR
jgi:hypothetical protein